tara:strand:- start:417 stop:719 length:303 start_codon:yes stop_codon:yes gene_type:complete
MKTIFKNNFFLLISSILFLYFFFSLLDGDRGLISYFEKKNVLNKLLEQEKILKIKIEDLEFKNSLLSDNLDLDFIETLIREKFIFGNKNDQIYIIQKSND